MQDLRYDREPDAPFFWLMHSIMGAVETSIDADPCLTEIEYAVGLQITAIRDTQQALHMLGNRPLGKRQKAAKPLLNVYLHKMKENTLSETWQKGLATTPRVQDRMHRLAKDTTRFLEALNLVTHKSTPLSAISGTVRRYKNDVKELH